MCIRDSTQNVRLRQGETAIICEDLPDSADAYYTVYNYEDVYKRQRRRSSRTEHGLR